jgi:hypothetical protein
MQQIALPSIYEPRGRPVVTGAFPLVRRRASSAAARLRPRKFVAGLLFGVLMSFTLVLLGYEARLYVDQHPEFLRDARDLVSTWMMER